MPRLVGALPRGWRAPAGGRSRPRRGLRPVVVGAVPGVARCAAPRGMLVASTASLLDAAVVVPVSRGSAMWSVVVLPNMVARCRWSVAGGGGAVVGAVVGVLADPAGSSPVTAGWSVGGPARCVVPLPGVGV